MTSLQIGRDTLQKLTHQSLEIRLRTLGEISSKINRAIELNENIEFKPSNLCKQLIRWFGFKPVQQPLKVLKLLESILNSSTYGAKAINILGAERLLKEFGKVQTIFDNQTAEQKIINKIKEILEKYSKHTEVKHEICKRKSTSIDELISSTTNMNLDEGLKLSCEDYEIPWSRPSPSDYTSIKFLSDILINRYSSTEEIENTLQHLQLIMVDYPVEYMLQPPNIFRNLLHIYDERNNVGTKVIPVEVVGATLLEFLVLLDKHIKKVKKSMSFNNTIRMRNSSQLNSLNTQASCQLKFEKALAELFEVSIIHLEMHSMHGKVSPVVWEIIFMISKLMKSIEGTVDITCLHKVASIAVSLSSKFTETENCSRLRLYQMKMVFLLQDLAGIILKSKRLKSTDIFESIMRDYVMKYLFSIRYKLMETNVINSDKFLNEQYQLLKSYEMSFEMAIKILKDENDWSYSDIITQGDSACKVLDKLQSKHLIDILFNAIIKASPLYRSNVNLKSQAIILLLKLLNLTCLPLKRYTYDKICSSFKSHIGCLMTGERYISECSNSELLKAHIVGIPLNTELLLQFIYNSSENSCDEVQTSCFKILELLLQSQSLFGTNWYNLLPLIIPVLPLLTCCTSSKKIMDLLLKFYNPDLKLLPYMCVLKGNLVFLFHSNTELRSEALTRLLYSINSLRDADKYMPNLLGISDTLLNDICLQSSPKEYSNIFRDRLPVRCEMITSLNNLLQLLESPDVEPLIRKTTLMQINVLCSNWHLTGELCNTGAYYLILQALENALQQSSVLDYPDAAVPAISILNKVMLYDSSVRCELSETPNIYILLLRALMMYNHDIQIRQDATMCLFQLLFTSQLISTDRKMEGPLILGNIRIPFNINLCSTFGSKIQQELEKLSILFGTAFEENQYWRMVIASTYCAGLANITHKSVSILSQLDFREDLKLTSQDVRFIRATQTTVSLLRISKAALNFTDHKSLTQACLLMKQHLLVATLNYTFDVQDAFCININIILQKYLQMPPGNQSDLELYENLLDVLIICLKIPLNLVILEIFKFVQKDTRHALITMITQSEEIPLRIYNKITVILRLLISQCSHIFEEYSNSAECSGFYSNLFDLLIERCLQLFEIRDLQRVRCLLSLMACISSCDMYISDQLLLFYCRRLAQLSLGLKSYNQTGAQWHRHCLLCILQLSNQMQSLSTNFRLSAGFIKYVSGLCGHNDAEVRILSWSILYVTSKIKSIESSQTEYKSINISGSQLLINELSYLPGGFMACCLSTLLDVEEIVGVRHLAGQLLATLIRKQYKEDEGIEKLFAQHNFMRSLNEALASSVCILDEEMPINMDTVDVSVTTCDLLSCFALICVELSLHQPLFLKELCTSSFMFKLYEILKFPPPYVKHTGYLNMVGHICRLYTVCYSNNFIFLQRTICRDIAWITAFCRILFGIVVPSEDVSIIIDMLQLLMVLCKDSTALNQLSIKMMDHCTEIVKFFQYTFIIKNLNTRLQSCAFSVLSLLLVKSQNREDKELCSQIITLFENSKLSNISTRCENFESDNKENNENIKKEIKVVKVENKEKSSISEHLCIILIRLFTHLYPIKACKFSMPPNANQQHVTETLALLLKQSPVAQESAHNLKLHDKLLKIFKDFLNEFASTSCTTYIKRNGENKKMAVIKNIQLLLKMLLSWYSSPAAMITDSISAIEYSKILIQIWPWLAYSNDLKLTVLETSAFMSERSLVVCKQFSTLNNNSVSHSVLQLIAKLVTAETLKIKATSMDCSRVICMGLRTLINCCSCIEGRTALNKFHIFDVLDSIHPFNPKASQIKMEILMAWLKFWELFSRYDEGAQSHHLNALCSVINKSTPQSTKRLISLRILRNMTFLNSNRSGLITSNDFLYTINEIILQPIENSVEEQFIVCVALWKLISGGIKFVAMIRSTKLAKHLRVIKDQLTSIQEEDAEIVEYGNNLLNILNIIFKIFSN